MKQQKIANKGIVDAQISSDHRFTVFASTNHNIGVWDNDKGNLRYEWSHAQKQVPNIVALSISGNNRYVLTAEKRNIVLWDAQTGKALRYLAVKSDIQAIALSHKGSRALLGLQNAKAIYLDLDSGQKLKSLQHLETINSVALSRDGRYALTGSDDKLAVLWDLKTNKPLHQWKHAKRVRYVTFSPQSNYTLTAASQDSINIWHVNTGQLASQLKGKSLTITAAQFSQDESQFSLGLVPNQIELRQTNNAQLLRHWKAAKPNTWKPSSNFFYAVSLDKDNNMMSVDSQGFLSWWK